MLFTVLLAVMYGSFAYDLTRIDFVKLISLYGALFFLSYQLIKQYGQNFNVLLAMGVLFRLVFLFAIPNLSQDFYRFLWDGHWIAEGINPYLFTPQLYLESPAMQLKFPFENAAALYEGMDALNGSHFTNYPPVNQLLFALSALLGGHSVLGNIMVLRILILLADVGILYFGKRLLEQLTLPAHTIFWYFLNPFIIIELTGNLHFEGVMLFFFVVSLFFLQKNKWLLSAAFLGLSISTKLIPLMFLPLYFQWFWTKKDSFFVGLKKLLFYYLLVLGTVLLTFLPFLSSAFFTNYIDTTALWFQQFEFNASIYYIVRWIGFQTIGWNIIETVGKILPFIIIAFILILTFFRKNESLKQLITAMLFSIFFYFLLSTTIHPWYIATPLLLSVFTKYRFPIVWTATVMLSYFAYKETTVEENFWLIAIEYLVVIGFAAWEIFFKRANSQKQMQGL
ncbi:MAG: mannosyltransferase [Flavobacteriaceae bacterium]|nr:mannosyltransferase [Flavobacteriaceae bacterium]